MYVDSIQYNGMTKGLTLPPFLINNPDTGGIEAMTESSIPLSNPESQPTTKFCYGCNTEKDIKEFNKNRVKEDGLQTRCISCMKKHSKMYYEANKELIQKKHREYYKQNACQTKEKRNDPEYKKAKREYNERYYQEHVDKLRKYAKDYQRENQDPVAMRQYRKEYWENNKAVLTEKNKEYRRENKEVLAEQKKLYVKKPGVQEHINKWGRNRRKSDPAFRLNCNISAKISRSLRESREGHHWEDLVGYTLKDLKKHLEKQFIGGMSWDNYGKWHVDHKVPLAVHNFKSLDDMDFKRAWALKNLQPLWAHDNYSKNDSIDRPFQPSLAFGGVYDKDC